MVSGCEECATTAVTPWQMSVMCKSGTGVCTQRECACVFVCCLCVFFGLEFLCVRVCVCVCFGVYVV